MIQNLEERVTLYQKIVDYFFSENPERDTQAGRQMVLHKVMNWPSLHVDQIQGVVDQLNLPLSPAYQRVLSEFYDSHEEVKRCDANTRALLRGWQTGGFVEFTTEACESALGTGLLAYNTAVIQQRDAAQALEADRQRMLDELFQSHDSFSTINPQDPQHRRKTYYLVEMQNDTHAEIKIAYEYTMEMRRLEGMDTAERRKVISDSMKQQVRDAQAQEAAEFQLINESTGKIFTRDELLRAEKSVFVNLLYLNGSPRPDFKIREAAINRILRGR
jgi:hypothetical protein